MWEFEALAKAAGYDLNSRQEAQLVFHKVDIDGSGTVSHSEFELWFVAGVVWRSVRVRVESNAQTYISPPPNPH